MGPVTLSRIMLVKRYLEANGPVQAQNVWAVARAIGIGSQQLTQVLAIVRSPEWIADNGWTIPYVSKGLATKVYSVERTRGQTGRLRRGNKIKSSETETHLRRNLAGLKLEAKLATGVAQQKALVLATTTEAALTMIDQLKRVP